MSDDDQEKAAEEAAAALDEKEKKKKQSDVLIALARKNVDLFYRCRDRSYADIRVNGHRETWQVRSTRFRQWLKRLYFAEHKTVPHSDGVKEAIDLLDGAAQFDGEEKTVCLRYGESGGRFYIDIGDTAWQAIEIGSEGWKIIAEPPVRFYRPAGLRPLVLPARGGSVEGLRRFINVRSTDDFVLIVCWMLTSMRPRGPYPVLVITGEQGSAKSTLLAMLRRLLDPNASPLRTLPREDRDLFIAAGNGWLLALDNVSGLPHWLSDSLSRLATGGGFAVRALYADDEETLFDACRPIALDGIEDIVARADLADRSIFVALGPIAEHERRAEDELWADFEQQQPAIFGALLDALAHGLRCLPGIHLDRLPRMADFAKWATACETAMWESGTFKTAYAGNQAEAVEVLIDSDQMATAVKRLMATHIKWEGSASQLKLALEAAMFGTDPQRPKGWPADATRLSGAIRRAAPALRKIGINIAWGGEGRKRRDMVISLSPVKEGESASPASPSTKSPENDNDDNGLSRDAKSNGSASPSVTEQPSVTPSVTPKSLKTNGGDAGDAGDAKKHSFAGGGSNDFDAVAEELAAQGAVYAEVRIRTFTPPAIAAGPDDDLADIGWRQ